GELDLAVTSGSWSSVAVLWSRGKGGFEAPRPLDAGKAPQAAAPGDFDSDGSLDIAVLDYDASTVHVFPSGGNGSTPKAFPATYLPDSLLALDFDQDGLLDLALGSQVSSSVIFWQNLGGLSFQEVGNTAWDPDPNGDLVSGPLSLVPIDVDGDKD